MGSTVVPQGITKEMESILAAALALSPADREEIAERLMASLKGADAEKLSAEQIATLQRRLGEVKDGKVKSIPAQDALRMAKERTTAML